MFVDSLNDIDIDVKRNNKKCFIYFITEKGKYLLEATELQYYKKLKIELSLLC